ncbi:MAG: hypothetical protein BAJATHORv1_40281 [Candidatus Thorarchaeota archaeon]|nr:MAG: hypothetical protein BAJATHORv1_40281 [Candidatus Thorarchaeota archaeon]
MVSFIGEGASINDPIRIVDVVTHFEAIDAEYHLLRELHGKKDEDWFLIKQTLLSEQGRYIDVLDIQLADGTLMSIFFDITEFWGKF